MAMDAGDVAAWAVVAWAAAWVVAWCENMATMFPPPEVDENRATLNMFPRPQVDNIVAFLKTLTDGYFER